MKVILIVAFLALAQIASGKVSYDGYRLIRISPNQPEQIELLRSFEENVDFDVWNSITRVNATFDVSIPPASFANYSSILQSRHIPFVILNENIQDLFNAEEEAILKRPKNSVIVGKFASVSEIHAFIDNIVSANPNLASSYIAGRSAGNRNLKVIVLKTATSKRNIWIDCGIHAREWISPTTCVWFINKLVTGYVNGDSSVMSLLNYFEFHVLPVLNPDGYEYSRDFSRMWRKNRSKNVGSSCVGVDLNRNFGYYWRTGGSSTDPCSDTFAGPSADSEPETRAVESALQAKLGKWDSYITIHTYGLWWFTPMGYTAQTNVMSDYNDLMAKALIGVNAIKSVNNTPFTYGSSAKILYIASGGSEDWAYGVAKIKYAYCLELRPGQSGVDSSAGFALPESRAPLAGEETYVGIAAFLKSIIVV